MHVGKWGTYQERRWAALFDGKIQPEVDGREFPIRFAVVGRKRLRNAFENSRAVSFWNFLHNDDDNMHVHMCVRMYVFREIFNVLYTYCVCTTRTAVFFCREGFWRCMERFVCSAHTLHFQAHSWSQPSFLSHFSWFAFSSLCLEIFPSFFEKSGAKERIETAFFEWILKWAIQWSRRTRRRKAATYANH